MDLVVPILMAAILLFAALRNVDVFEAFKEGANDGLKVIFKIVPVIVGLVTAINMFRASGGFDLLGGILHPVTSLFGISEELVPLMIMRPISGSAAIAMLTTILRTAGPDSYIGRVASVACGSTETTIYTTGIYMGSAGVKRMRYALPVGLLCDLFAFIMSMLTVRLLLGGP